VIDEIRAEKAEVCEGEENLVTVRAHTENGTDAYLRYVTGSELGSQVPVRAYLDDSGQQQPMFIQVFGRNNTVTARTFSDRPLFRVKDCAEPSQLTLGHTLTPNSQRHYRFTARISTSPRARDLKVAKAFEAVRYVWDFGDGTTVETRVPAVDHEYAPYVETTLTTNFLARVDAYDASGSKVSGRSALTLFNQSFESFAYRRGVKIVAIVNPRYPVLDADGKVRQTVTLFHHRPDEVFIDSIRRVRSGEDDAEGPPTEVAVATLLRGARSIAPGLTGVTFDVELDAGTDPRFVMERYEITGTSGDGFPAAGAFSVMKPPPPPTEKDEPVADAVTLAKVLEARRLLGKEFVTDGDLARLEQEGRFRNLAIGPAPIVAARPRASRKAHPPMWTETEPASS
jgi:hypothetical protein